MRELPPIVRAFIAKKYPGQDVKVDASPYWSTVRFQFSIAGALAVGSRQAFSYAIGGDRTPAGFLAAAGLATMADTNLQKPGETRLNADIFVNGISAYFTPESDAALIRKVVRECAVTLSTDGQNTTPLATLEMIPAGGGLMGVGRSGIKQPPLDTGGLTNAGEGAVVSFVNNGNPMAGNFLELGAPVLWSGQNGVDSNFRLNFDIGRAISEPVAALRAAAAGILAYTPPAAQGDDGTYVDLRVRLHCWAISKLTVNG